MTPSQFRDLLLPTLTDEQLTRSERQALTAVLAEDPPADGQLENFRQQAFELAKDRLQHVRLSREVLDWLGDVLRLLSPANEAATSGGEAYFSPGQTCRRKIRELFGLAKASVDVCVFTITDDDITSAIAAAHQRGVRIRILTDNDKSLDLGSDIERLRKMGVDVREDITPHHMHHKFAIYDSTVLLTGSYNWTRSAADHNEENFIVTRDRKLLADFQGVFNQMWERFAV